MFQIFVNVRVLQSFLNSPWSRKLIAPAKKKFNDYAWKQSVLLTFFLSFSFFWLLV